MGFKYGLVTPFEFLYRDTTAKQVWLCKCDCGNVFKVKLNALKTGNTKSCGCWNLTQIRNRNFVHGYARRKAKSKEYLAWTNMKARCNNPTDPRYPHYGARGIKVCSKWNTSFSAFLADLGKSPQENLELERINNDGDYEPSNCTWATRSQQCLNQRRNLARRGV